MVCSHRRLSLKAFTLFLAVSLFLNQTQLLADSAILNNSLKLSSSFSIEIPKNLGDIKSSYVSNGNKIVIHIQDMHANEEAQLNIARMIDFLSRKYGVKTVAVEGAEGELKTRPFSALPGREERMDAASYYLKNGRLSGPEYLAIVERPELRLLGVEEEALYDMNLTVYRQALKNREKALAAADELESLFDRLSRYVLSRELLNFIKKRRAYWEHAFDFFSYADFLKSQAALLNLKIEEYPNFSTLSDVLTKLKEKQPANVSEDAGKINPDVFREIGSIEDEIESKLIKNSEEKKLVLFLRVISTLKQMFEFSLTREQVDFFYSNRKDFNIRSIGLFARPLLLKHKFEIEIPENLTLIDSQIEKVETFYDLALKRDQVLIRKAVQDLNAGNENITVLVTGGFHTPGIESFLKKSGVSYIVATPAVKKAIDFERQAAVYEDSMLDGSSDFQKMFAAREKAPPLTIQDSQLQLSAKKIIQTSLGWAEDAAHPTHEFWQSVQTTVLRSRKQDPERLKDQFLSKLAADERAAFADSQNFKFLVRNETFGTKTARVIYRPEGTEAVNVGIWYPTAEKNSALRTHLRGFSNSQSVDVGAWTFFSARNVAWDRLPGSSVRDYFQERAAVFLAGIPPGRSELRIGRESRVEILNQGPLDQIKARLAKAHAAKNFSLLSVAMEMPTSDLSGLKMKRKGRGGGGQGLYMSEQPSMMSETGVASFVLAPLFKGDVELNYGTLEEYKKAYGGIEFLNLSIPVGSGLIPLKVIYIVQQGVPVFQLYDPYGHFFNQLYTLPAPDTVGSYIEAILLSRAAREIMLNLGIKFNTIQYNDWQAGLGPFYSTGDLTVHNLEYQGIFPGKLKIDETADPELQNYLWINGVIPDWAYNKEIDLFQLTHINPALQYNTEDGFEWWGSQVPGMHNMLKGAALQARRLVFVSKRHEWEALNQDRRSYGLSGVLRKRKSYSASVYNGIDTKNHRPVKLKALDESGFERPSKPFEEMEDGELAEWKAKNKKGLQEKLGLEVSAEKIILGAVTRIVKQKGLNILMTKMQDGRSLLEHILDFKDPKTGVGVQVVILGTAGDDKDIYAANQVAFLKSFLDLHPKYAGSFKFVNAHDTALSKQISAGADASLLASIDEPGGLRNLEDVMELVAVIVSERGGLVDFYESGGTPLKPIRGFEVHVRRPDGSEQDFHDDNAEARRNSARDILDRLAELAGIYKDEQRYYPMLRKVSEYDPDWKYRIPDYREFYLRSIYLERYSYLTYGDHARKLFDELAVLDNNETFIFRNFLHRQKIRGFFVDPRINVKRIVEWIRAGFNSPLISTQVVNGETLDIFPGPEYFQAEKETVSASSGTAFFLLEKLRRYGPSQTVSAPQYDENLSVTDEKPVTVLPWKGGTPELEFPVLLRNIELTLMILETLRVLYENGYETYFGPQLGSLNTLSIHDESKIDWPLFPFKKGRHPLTGNLTEERVKVLSILSVLWNGKFPFESKTEGVKIISTEVSSDVALFLKGPGYLFDIFKRNDYPLWRKWLEESGESRRGDLERLDEFVKNYEEFLKTAKFKGDRQRSELRLSGSAPRTLLEALDSSSFVRNSLKLQALKASLMQQYGLDYKTALSNNQPTLAVFEWNASSGDAAYFDGLLRSTPRSHRMVLYAGTFNVDTETKKYFERLSQREKGRFVFYKGSLSLEDSVELFAKKLRLNVRNSTQIILPADELKNTLGEKSALLAVRAAMELSYDLNKRKILSSITIFSQTPVSFAKQINLSVDSLLQAWRNAQAIEELYKQMA